MTLNNAQKEAVLHTEGPLLVLAGAGAGKTRVITHRILNLIERGVAPENILAVTFTNKAAREMRERVKALLENHPTVQSTASPQENGPFISTFHALGAHILRNHARAIKLTRSFSIFDRSDSIRALKDAMEHVGVDPKEFEPRKILGTISRQKGNAVGLAEYQNEAHEFYPRLVATIWEAYEQILKREGALDFDDLLLKTLSLLKTHRPILTHHRDLWRYLHIDEYQDTNRVQTDLAHLLAQPRNNICVVGDVDQNIYSWRGANIENILSFEETYHDAKTILLEQNYRSTKTILDASNTIIKKNTRRREKKLFTKNPEGEKITLVGLYDENAEAHFIAEQTAKERGRGIHPQDIAILYRANFQSRALEEAFLAHNIPYQVLGVRFFERKEVKDILSFIRAALNPESWSDIKRIVNVPPRGIGKVTLLAMISQKERALSSRARKNVADFKALLENIKDAANTQPPSKTVAFVLSRTGLEEILARGTEDDLERLLNIRELVTLATRYDTLTPEEGVQKLLEDAALATDQDELKEEYSAVRLMTVHASKGLEFDTVFITGLEEGLFPHNSLTDGREERVDDEEERRLFYVALTRAKRKIFLTYTSVRMLFGSKEVNIPSEFITDIDEHCIETEEMAGENGTGHVLYID